MMNKASDRLLLAALFIITVFLLPHPAAAQRMFHLVELNCENLFDTRHDSLKLDMEFLPDGPRYWSRTKYWRKLKHIGQELLACTPRVPDIIALCEVENDSVLRDLTRRSILRNAGYDYLMTESPDLRGMDVALLYQPFTFRPICYDALTVPPLKNMRPTRDILYVKGETISRDTLHLFIVHAPSRYGGERLSRPHRLQVCKVLLSALAGLAGEKVIVAGDFNDYATDEALRMLEEAGLVNVTRQAKGTHGTKANYRHDGLWRNLDHVLVSPPLLQNVDTAYVSDPPFLLEDDLKYGGKKPFRTFNGFRYQPGFSDHLPLVVGFGF